MGKISVNCFNRAYEEQLTRIFSYNQVESGSSEESDTKLVNINNKKANEDLRVNYMKYLLLELKLKTEAETTNMPSILTTSVIGKWDKTKDNNVNGTTESTDETVKTGDTTPIALYVVLMLCALAGIVFISKKRRTSVK